MPIDKKSLVSAAQTQLNALKVLDGQFDTKINAIKDAEWSKPLTAGQLNQISDLRTQQAAIESAIEELAYVTMGALDKSDEITRMANALAGIVKDLKARTDKIAAVGAKSQEVASVCDRRFDT
jgi:chromosome segregation ATPase